jgi:glycosyltransferase involved in cell wall biosynthesis
MTNAPLASLIIPCYNYGRYLGEALESALGQDQPGLEIIVVDDGSSDETLEVARSFPGVVAIHQENAGDGAARNRGAAAARGEVLVFMDADDILTSDSVSRRYQLLRDHPEFGYAVCYARNFPCPRTGAVLTPAQHEVVKGIGTCVFSVRRDVFDQLGGFDRRATANDLEWLVRASELGLKCGVVPEVLVHRRIHGENISRDYNNKKILFGLLAESVARKRRAAELGDTAP